MVHKEVSCTFCSKVFRRKSRQVNEAVKFGWKQYCSLKCLAKDKITSTIKPCSNCGKKVSRTPSDASYNNSGRFFCSRHCAAVVNNRIRNLSHPLLKCKVKTCTRIAPRGNIYCSRKCAASLRKKDRKTTIKEVIKDIRKFYRLHDRIPVKKEKYGMYKKARNSFGSWNKAVEAAGFKPNPVMFANKYMARDGHVCDSLAEKIIDEWFRSKGISHERSVSYPEFERMTCDFVVGKFFIEFFGLEGEHREYTKHVHKKRWLAKKYNLKLIEIKPIHLFPKNKLNQVLNFLI